jgi:hypothetical protein
MACRITAMRRLLSPVTLAVAVAGAGLVGALALGACGGGNDKPPLTPDTIEPPTDLQDAAAPPTAPAPPPAK